MDSLQVLSCAQSSASSTASPSLGIKAEAKRQHQLAAKKERKNGLLLLPDGRRRSRKEESGSAAVTRLLGADKKDKAASCCRMLFDTPDHDDVLDWLNEGLAQHRQRMTDKYGFDLTQADEGVYAVPCAAVQP